MNLIRLSIVGATIAALFRCADVDLASTDGEGNGSETIARGVIVDSAGIPAAGIPVQLLPAAYDPVSYDTLPEGWHAFTDVKGEYRLGGIGAGTYALEAGFAFSDQKALIKGVEISGGKIEVVTDTGWLRKTGTIIVQLAGLTPREGDYVYLPGTSEFTIIAARDSVAGHVPINGVPAATYADLIYVAATGSRDTNLLRDSMTVHPGDTTASAFAAWKYARRFVLNTTLSGADIRENIYNFPILIRLNDAIFDFSQTKSGGEDLRFAKSDGSLLAHEIERWDAGERKAEIWVKIDTVYGNSDNQWISMYWGNPGAPNTPLTGMVFDTAAGFQGVWHLAETANDIAHDATANRYDGTPSDTAPDPAAGAIGIAREFNGVSNGIRMKGTAASSLNFQENGRYTVSAWVYSDTLDDKWHLIVGKSNGQYYLKQQIKSRYGNWEFVEYHDKSGWQLSESPMTLKTWKYLTGVREGDRQYLYIDGQMADSAIKPNYDTASRSTSDDVTIGRYQTSVRYENEGFCFFDGTIDEVRISSVSRSADWIKLCFMNQREDDRLIVFKR